MKKKFALIIFFGILLLVQPMSAQTWEATKKLTWTSGKSDYPAMALDSNDHIHVVRHDDTIGNNEIYYMKSTDGGGTWSGDKKLTWNSGNSRNPAIAIDSNNNVHVIWSDDSPGNAEIYYKKSTNGGVTWSAKRLTWNSGSSYYPAVAIGQSDSIHVIWYDSTPGNCEIFHKKSTNGGSTWTTKRLTWNSGFSSSPAITVGLNYHIHVAWTDSSPGNKEVYYKKSTDGGSTWALSKRLTWTSDHSYSPAITTDSNQNIHVAFDDVTPGNREIYYKKSTDGGGTWTTKRLTWNSDSSVYAAIAVDTNDNVHLVCSDGPAGNYRLFHKISMNGGVSWSTRKLSWNYAIRADISIDLINNIHVVWAGTSNAIYYKKGIQ